MRGERAAGGGAPSARGGAPGFARARSASLNRCSWDTGSKTSDAASPEDPPGGGRDAASREGPLAGPKVPLEDPAAAEDDDDDNEEAEDKEDEDDAAMGGAVTLAYEEDNVDADEEDDAEDDADTAVQGEATGAMPAEDPPEGAAI